MEQLNYINLGCGKRYHSSWTNVDFVAKEGAILGCNLLSGIPFEENTFDVVYHSHLLEHFNKRDAINFMKECYRVAKVGGIIRVAVPDLERIVSEYQKNLDRVLNDEIGAEADYDWIMLELYDQVVRNKSGGDMANYLYRETLENETYIYKRIGEEARELRLDYLKNQNRQELKSFRNTKADSAFQIFKAKVKRFFLKREDSDILMNDSLIKLGKFRMGGEVHQWMYDRYSLARLMKTVGFEDIKVTTAFDSRIPNWVDFELESKNGIVFKPDSLFIEAVKME